MTDRIDTMEDKLELIESLLELALDLVDHLETGATAETETDVDHAITEARRLAIELAQLR